MIVVSSLISLHFGTLIVYCFFVEIYREVQDRKLWRATTVSNKPSYFLMMIVYWFSAKLFHLWCINNSEVLLTQFHELLGIHLRLIEAGECLRIVVISAALSNDYVKIWINLTVVDHNCYEVKSKIDHLLFYILQAFALWLYNNSWRNIYLSLGASHFTNLTCLPNSCSHYGNQETFFGWSRLV